jgi:hypothetical protein
MGKTRRLSSVPRQERRIGTLVVAKDDTATEVDTRFVRPFGSASALEKSNVMGILLGHKITRFPEGLAYVCTGCGSIGEGPDAESRDNFLANADVSCCGIVYTFEGGI